MGQKRKKVVKPMKRVLSFPFEATEISKIYMNLLIPMEIDDLDLKGYKVDGFHMLQAKKRLGFELDTKGEIKVGESAIPDTFYYRKTSGYSSIPSLLKHLRNAFAHNRIFEDNNHNIILEDEYKRVLNMHVRLASIDRLIEIVNAIKVTKGLHQAKKGRQS